VTPTDWFEIGVIVVLILVVAFNAATEVAITRTNRVRALRLVEEGRRGAVALSHIAENPANYLNVVLLLTLLAGAVGFCRGPKRPTVFGRCIGRFLPRRAERHLDAVPVDGVGPAVGGALGRIVLMQVAIILGGIIRNSDSKTSSGVPYLKDIPLLGALFRTTSDTKSRQESIVLMRPTVLRTPELAAMQVNEERRHMPGISEAASETAHYEKKMEEREAIRLQKEKAADKAQEDKYKAQEQKLLNTPDPLVP
jgi:hypothetical protein